MEKQLLHFTAIYFLCKRNIPFVNILHWFRLKDVTEDCTLVQRSLNLLIFTGVHTMLTSRLSASYLVGKITACKL